MSKMEESFVALVKSYIASEERLRNMQTKKLKQKISYLSDELYAQQIEFVSREQNLIIEIKKLKRTVVLLISLLVLGTCAMLIAYMM